MSLFADFLKQPTSQGVHLATGLGNSRDTDRKNAEYDQEDAKSSVSSPRPRGEKPKPKSDTDEDIDQVRGVKPGKKAWSLPLKITKTVPDLRLIYGWASVVARDGVRIVDKQDDVIPVEELENAVIEYSLNSRKGGDMHDPEFIEFSNLIESFVFTPEKEKLGIVAKDDQGRVIHGWWTGFYVPDDKLWASIKRGERPEFSIGGQAVPVELKE
jgi:hypothetical protein